MTQQPDGGGDLSYDEAHDAHVAQRSRRTRPEGAPPPEVPPEQSGDYSYDLAHDVPRG